MALETLKDVKELGGFDVVNMGELKEKYPHMFREDGSMKYEIFEKEIRPNKFIYIRPDVNSISFTIQNGAIKENGVNGCQVDSLIYAANEIITALNKKFPCKENETCIYHLGKALQALDDRKRDREKREVEGFTKK